MNSETLREMYNLIFFSLIVGLLAVAYLFRSKHKKLPPSPVGFPVIGHLHLLKEPVHRCLRDLSRNLGPVYSLQLGSRRAVVVTSASAAEVFLTHQNEEAREVRDLIRETSEFAGFTYVGDFLPILKLFDFDGYLKRCKKLGSKLDKFLQNLVDEHRRNRGKTEFEKTMITHLLCLQESEPEYYTDDIIKGPAMLLAGTDTTAVTLEWAMANLLNHPDVLKKTKSDLNDVVSRECLMEESDVNKCTYLNNVISETLRLYPSLPLLLPHESSEDCVVAGYDIPRGSWLFVNAWAIHRDPKVWDEPESFKLKRFESETHHGMFLPFGIGGRGCPGMGLGRNVLGLAIGSLIQCFDWERDDDVEVDMSEGRGLTMPKAVPLVAKCKSCPILDKVML